VTRDLPLLRPVVSIRAVLRRPRPTRTAARATRSISRIPIKHGHKANYVRNIEANTRVRVNAGRGWRTGTARIVDDDPEARLAHIVALNPRARANADIVRNTGTENLVIRIDLAE
jgi:deazaflavin-dependent oxidoreductase (nitroreductase family)